MEEDFGLEELEKFDIFQAEKLLQNIRNLADFRKFRVHKPNSLTMETTSMQEWLKWYIKTTEWNGTTGTEHEVVKIIYNIDSDMQILSNRVEEGFRMLLTALDKRNLRIKILLRKIKEYETGNKIIEDEDPSEEDDDIEPDETDDMEDTEEESAEEEKERKQKEVKEKLKKVFGIKK